MSKLSPSELANEFTNFVNNFNCDSDAFIDAMFKQHRTLQQSSLKVMLKMIERMAQDDYQTDGRNQQSKVICQDLIKGFKSVVFEREVKDSNNIERTKKYVKSELCVPSKFLGSI